MKRLETDALWTAVDDYVNGLLAPNEPVLEAALQATKDAGLPPINVAPNQGKLLMLLARAIGARRILEIGTLGGYSTIWLARGLAPDGRLITIEWNPACVKVARANLASAGLGSQVEVREGSGADVLPGLAAEAPFDLIFIDADKPNTPLYFEWAVKLARKGSLIVVDNVVREGAILDKDGGDDVQGMRRFFALAASDPRVTGTALQTVGAKGHDGLAVLLVTAEP
ncbi:MAG TPA: O-methyltransferase [Methyloceanibacter sp.]|jgi:predicted O-methyltransferase YrrM|nr:O-methyltransferase [Methyloceanibacter sp.]